MVDATGSLVLCSLSALLQAGNAETQTSAGVSPGTGPAAAAGTPGCGGLTAWCPAGSFRMRVHFSPRGADCVHSGFWPC